MIIYQPTDMFVTFTNGKFDTKPIGFFHPCFFLTIIRNYRKFNHGAKIRPLLAPSKQQGNIGLEEELPVFLTGHDRNF